MKALISGTSGNLGATLIGHFNQMGWEVRGLCHVSNPDPQANQNFIPFQLGDEPRPEWFQGVDTFVHCAYDFKARAWEDIKRINVDGSIKLLKMAHQSSVKRVIFISSISAFDHCISLYGRSKLAVEMAMRQYGTFLIRPGLIYGSKPQGIYGNLFNAVKKFPIIPLIDGGKPSLFLVHIGDLIQLIFQIAKGTIGNPRKPIPVAHPESISIKQIVQTLAQSLGAKKFYFSIPFSLAYGSLKGLEGIGLMPRLRSDSLVGMVHSDKAPDFSIIKSLGISFRRFTVDEIKSK